MKFTIIIRGRIRKFTYKTVQMFSILVVLVQCMSIYFIYPKRWKMEMIIEIAVYCAKLITLEVFELKPVTVVHVNLQSGIENAAMQYSESFEFDIILLLN